MCVRPAFYAKTLRFIEAWRQAKTVEDVAEALGLSVRAVRERRKELARRKGVVLPVLPHRKPPATNGLSVDERNSLLVECLPLVKAVLGHPRTRPFAVVLGDEAYGLAVAELVARSLCFKPHLYKDAATGRPILRDQWAKHFVNYSWLAIHATVRRACLRRQKERQLDVLINDIPCRRGLSPFHAAVLNEESQSN